MGDLIGRKVDIDIDQVAAQMIIGSTKAPKINDLTEKVGERLLSFHTVSGERSTSGDVT